MKSPDLLRRRCAQMLGLLLVLSGCSSHKPADVNPEPIGEVVTSVGQVVVTFDPKLDSNLQEQLTTLEANRVLRAAIETAVTKIAKLDSSSSRVLEVKISSFRMRHGALVWGVGIMAGVDHLDVAVRVGDGDHTVREYTTGAATSGAFAGLSQVSRFEKLSATVAERIAESL